jgi:hypothetical protein
MFAFLSPHFVLLTCKVVAIVCVKPGDEREDILDISDVESDRSNNTAIILYGDSLRRVCGA